ncbi:MAG: hypothetical protein JNL75_10785 [Chitinophagales bacterium]|nr:hypothetical protein [Chitinophagales bacterium]
MSNKVKWFLVFIVLTLVFNSHRPIETTPDESIMTSNIIHLSNSEIKYDLEELYAGEEIPQDKDVETVVTWNTLKNVRYEERPDPVYKLVHKPIYGKTVRELEDKTIQIKGFIIPITSNTYALSKNPFAACFFCGQAGPETVMGIQFRKLKDKLKTDMFVTLKGKFILNHDNPDDWMYHIIDAEIIEIK